MTCLPLKIPLEAAEEGAKLNGWMDAFRKKGKKGYGPLFFFMRAPRCLGVSHFCSRFRKEIWLPEESATPQPLRDFEFFLLWLNAFPGRFTPENAMRNKQHNKKGRDEIGRDVHVQVWHADASA